GQLRPSRDADLSPPPTPGPPPCASMGWGGGAGGRGAKGAHSSAPSPPAPLPRSHLLRARRGCGGEGGTTNQRMRPFFRGTCRVEGPVEFFAASSTHVGTRASRKSRQSPMNAAPANGTHALFAAGDTRHTGGPDWARSVTGWPGWKAGPRRATGCEISLRLPTMFDSLHYLLLQIRNPDDPMR